ncbi:MAG: hypothetical protein KME33_29565 [Aetokthonos hydrillicola CCALA 1050]|nr:hypothetical protein [Aetokthonos hydrillicola CCALA 1050]MBW4589298.1 hypothetical protein [Aetokthonos hydrillicola CCALA 1050]
MSKQAQIVMVFVLISILSVFGRLMPFKIATANATQLLQITTNLTNTPSFLLADSGNITSQEKLPAPVKNAVLKVASQDVKLPTSKLKIIEAQPRTWNNGCLEVSSADELCTQVLVNGWEVAVRASGKTLVYHTNDSGSVVRLNPNKSEISQNQSPTTKEEQIQPVTIPRSELPPPLERNVIFQQISSGGFAGITDKTMLLNDGSIIHVNIKNTNNSSRNVRRISRSQVQQFQDLLKKEKFSKFKNQSYPASTGSADYKTYTLTSREGTVQYNDISQSHLPNELQIIIKAWSQITQS